MAVETIPQLRTRAQQIKNETAQGANTANRVGTLHENSIDTFESIDNSIKTDVGTLKTDVGTLKTDVGTLKTDVGKIKTWQIYVQEEIDRLDIAIANVEKDVDKLVKKTIPDLEQKILWVEQYYNNLNNELTNTYNEFQGLFQEVYGMIGAVENRILAIEQVFPNLLTNVQMLMQNDRQIIKTDWVNMTKPLVYPNIVKHKNAVIYVDMKGVQNKTLNLNMYDEFIQDNSDLTFFFYNCKNFTIVPNYLKIAVPGLVTTSNENDVFKVHLKKVTDINVDLEPEYTHNIYYIETAVLDFTNTTPTHPL